jgi:hypothetical protein
MIVNSSGQTLLPSSSHRVVTRKVRAPWQQTLPFINQFESNSRLTRIESLSSLQRIVIPRSVRFTDGFAFCDMDLSSIMIDIGDQDSFVVGYSYQQFIFEDILTLVVHQVSQHSNEEPQEGQYPRSSLSSTKTQLSLNHDPRFTPNNDTPEDSIHPMPLKSAMMIIYRWTSDSRKTNFYRSLL